MKKLSLIIQAILLIAFSLMYSCSSSRSSFKPKHKKKKDCDCSGYTYLVAPLNSYDFLPDKNAEVVQNTQPDQSKFNGSAIKGNS